MKRNLLIGLSVMSAFLLGQFLSWNRQIEVTLFPNERLSVAGTERHYRLVIPENLRVPAPILFAFHGIGDTPESLATYSQLDELAAQHGFILVYPAALNSMWNVTENDRNNSDIRFFDQLREHLLTQHTIDTSQIFLAGMSNGATFVQLLATVRSESIAAVAAHSGTAPAQIEITEAGPPIMLLVGENDSMFSFMKSQSESQQEAGRKVNFVSIPGLGHAWATKFNDDLWEFFSDQTRDEN